MAAEIPLDGNSFFFYNYKHHHARMGLDSGNPRHVRSNETSILANQLWMLKSDPKYPGFYYICNCGFEGYRLTKNAPGDGHLIGYNENYFTDQMWKFKKEGEYYRIYNYKYPSAKLVQKGPGDNEMATFDGPDYTDQLWKLVPRFQVEVLYDIIWHADNRQGQKTFAETISVTQGIKLTQSSTVSTLFGFSVSMKCASQAGIPGNNVSTEVETEMHSQIETSVSHGSEETWAETTTIKFKAPAGKNYRVKQMKGYFTSELAQDNNNLLCSYVIEETDGEFAN